MLQRIPILFLLLGLGLSSSQSTAQPTFEWPDESACLASPPTDEILQGWCLAITRNKGNCVACHQLNIKSWPNTLPEAGNIAPPLAAMQLRFPERDALRQIVADAPSQNPLTTMPPYERHELLTSDEIDRIIRFLLTL